MRHKAVWINDQCAILQVGTAETPTPGPDQLLVKVNVVAISPIESKIQKYGLRPISYPNILGTAFSGIVERIGSEVTGFRPGDRVVVLRDVETPRFGAYQHFALGSAASSIRLSEKVSLDAAAASIANLITIVSALTASLGLDRPELGREPKRNGKKVLVYGGSSSCGGLAVGYAVAGGYEVVTTSSSRNRQFVGAQGPQVIIDHEQQYEPLLKDIRANGPYHAIFDAIGLPPVTNILVDYLHSVGGGSYCTTLPLLGPEKPIPNNVKRIFRSYGSELNMPAMKELREWFYDEFAIKALESGVIVPTRSQWVRGGLEKAQEALDLLDDNQVSGHKLVLDPWE